MKEPSQNSNRLFFIAVLLFIALACLFLFQEEPEPGVCSSSLEKITEALLRYCSDHQGRYPSELAELVPDYLPRIASCPECPRHSILPSYTCTASRRGFAVWCPNRHYYGPHDFVINAFAGDHQRIDSSFFNQDPDLCKSLLEEEGRLIGEYLKAHNGQRPEHRLVEDSVERPTCRSAHVVTYRTDNSFQVVCLSANHLYAGIKPLQPRYSSWSNSVSVKRFQAYDTKEISARSLTEPRMLATFLSLFLALYCFVQLIRTGLARVKKDED